MQSHTEPPHVIYDDGSDPTTLARAKRHSLILGLIFALIIIALPSKQSSQPTAARQAAPLSTLSSQPAADKSVQQPPVEPRSQHSAHGLRLTSTSLPKAISDH